MSTNVHLSVSVRALLRREFPKDFYGLFRHPDGRPLSAHEARETLFDHLAHGHEVIPLGPVCEGFDYTSGCPGHEVSADGKGGS